jgi:predicted transcriptional regulator
VTIFIKEIALHIKLGRICLDWDQADLAKRAGLSDQTIRRMEASTGAIRGTYENVQRVRKVLEQAGVVFIEADDSGGPGVRLRKAPTK